MRTNNKTYVKPNKDEIIKENNKTDVKIVYAVLSGAWVTVNAKIQDSVTIEKQVTLEI